MEAPLEEVSVKVPADRIAEFYQMYGRWLRGEAVIAEQVDDGDRQRQPWDPKSDVDVARTVWGQFPERAKLIFSTLMDHPGEKFSGDELAELHGIPNGKWGVAGVLAWPGRQLRKVQRDLPFEAESNPAGGSFYSMQPTLAELFKRARDSS